MVIYHGEKLKQFLSGSILADIHASGQKVVLSGTDSLGFLLARYNELYGRTQFIHTTYIPFGNTIPAFERGASVPMT